MKLKWDHSFNKDTDVQLPYKRPPPCHPMVHSSIRLKDLTIELLWRHVPRGLYIMQPPVWTCQAGAKILRRTSITHGRVSLGWSCASLLYQDCWVPPSTGAMTYPHVQQLPGQHHHHQGLQGSISPTRLPRAGPTHSSHRAYGSNKRKK